MTNPILQKIEDIHNWASDTNFVWFPFLRLKLRPEQSMPFRHRLLMTIFFGPYFSLFYTLRVWIIGRWNQSASDVAQATADNFWGGLVASIGPMAINMIWVTAFFFVWFNLVTAYFWNRRARRLQASASPTPTA
jgi:hypothetical protein